MDMPRTHSISPIPNSVPAPEPDPQRFTLRFRSVVPPIARNPRRPIDNRQVEQHEACKIKNRHEIGPSVTVILEDGYEVRVGRDELEKVGRPVG